MLKMFHLLQFEKEIKAIIVYHLSNMRFKRRFDIGSYPKSALGSWRSYNRIQMVRLGAVKNTRQEYVPILSEFDHYAILMAIAATVAESTPHCMLLAEKDNIRVAHGTYGTMQPREAMQMH
ncbi:hypothetical protein TKK_0019536 [Trichogramma kaykai]